MKVKIIADITGCKDCPLTEHIYEQGACGNLCKVSKEVYAWVPEMGIRDDCPFREVREIDISKK